MKRDLELLLLKLADGGWIRRRSDPRTPPPWEKRLESQESVVRQKQR